MNVTQAEFQNMKEEIIKDLIAFRMEDTGCSMQQAFDDVYHSKLFEKLCKPESGLYIQSSKYVYSYLLDELNCQAELYGVPMEWKTAAIPIYPQVEDELQETDYKSH